MGVYECLSIKDVTDKEGSESNFSHSNQETSQLIITKLLFLHLNVKNTIDTTKNMLSNNKYL